MSFTSKIAKNFMFTRREAGPTRITGLIAILGIGAAGGVAVTQGGRVIDKKLSDLGSRVTVDGSQRLLDEGRRKINKRGTGFLNINPSKTLPPPKGINRVLQSPFGKIKPPRGAGGIGIGGALFNVCLLYTSDAADE